MLTYLNWKELVELGLAGIASTVGLGIIGFCSWKMLEITIILLINNPPIGITVGILTIAILGSIMLSAIN